MISRFFCRLFGHKMWEKAFTPGHTYETIDRLTGMPTLGHYYHWARSPFCLRCGIDNPSYQEKKDGR